ncbi:MAG: hypothetical protein K0Q80_2821, partial [Microvirga sp.]|nr:hypothetical protein [Microvirga sp.]
SDRLEGGSRDLWTILRDATDAAPQDEGGEEEPENKITGTRPVRMS